MFTKKNIAALTVSILTLGSIGTSVFAADVIPGSDTGNNTTVNKIETKDKIQGNKEQIGQNRGKMQNNKGQMQGNKEQNKEIKKDGQGGFPFENLAGLSDTEKSALKELFASHKVEMDKLRESMKPQVSSDSTTPPTPPTDAEKTAFLEKCKVLCDDFIAKVKAITTNATVISFVETKMGTQDMKMENMQMHLENKDMRTENKNMKGQMQGNKGQMQGNNGPLILTDAEKVKVDTYYTAFKTKFSEKLAALTDVKIESINKAIDKYLINIKTNTEIKYQLLALKKLINEKFSTNAENLDIETLFQ